MIKHIVMFKMQDEAEGATGAQNARKIFDILNALPAQISQIKEYEVGVNIATSPAAWDLVLVSAFDSLDTLEAYRTHPAHQEALDFIKLVIADSSVVDYEI